jgi:hypothetical protein
MSESSEKIEELLRLARDPTARSAAPPPDADPQPSAEPLSVAGPAIARCRDAWQKAHDLYMEKNARKDGSLAKFRAAEQAAAAYRAAMPKLASWSGIRDFIACVAYGLLIDAIPPDRSGQLLYAAQTALSLLPRIPHD